MEESSANEIVLDFLPAKPTPLEPSMSDSIQIVGELPFDSLGLNSLWPAGRAQWCMEHIHIDLGAPWWLTILISEYKSFSLILLYIHKQNYLYL